MPNVIDSFSGEYRFLSNFYPCTIILCDGETFSSLEHAYQACKTLNVTWRKRIADADTPGQAKRLGKQCPVRSGWEEMKLTVMLHLLQYKFENEPLRSMLLATGDAELVEGNSWGDAFWGVCGGRGENMLGTLLMIVRAELR